MCGIVGVVGNERATSILVQGLEKLEYRGYDSAGIFVSNQTTDYLVKAKGRIASLVEKIPAEIAGNVGIGHTRWATHGKPTEQNAHPHQSPDQRLVLVHNGVIENYLELKEQFLAGETLIGETDTEIIVGVIRALQKETGDLQTAFQQALKLIHGSYALALVDREAPDTVYVAKNKSPLLIGLGEGFQVICSDAMAMIQETNRFVEIMDGEMVIVRAQGITILDPSGAEVTREAYVAELDVTDLGKGTYPYYMLKEIDEQPAVMRKLAQKYIAEDGQLEIDSAVIAEIKESDRIYIVACGTSAHAGWVGKNLLESLTGIPVEIHLSSEFGYHMPLLSAKPFFIFLSQSGETADSRQVLVEINRLGHPSLTITNVPGSTLSREAQFTLLLHAGPEIAVASTKAYTAQIALLALLAKAVGDEKGNAQAQALDLAHELSLVATAMDAVVGEKEQIAHYATEYFHEIRNAFYIGRGVDYYLSMEAALKLKEISYIQAEGFAAGELKHGTIALIEEGTPVIAFISDEKTAAHTRGNVQEVQARGAHTLVIAAEGLDKEEDALVLPAVHPLLRPLVSILPAQLLAYYATIDRGLDVDKPRNLAKSVTVE